MAKMAVSSSAESSAVSIFCSSKLSNEEKSLIEKQLEQTLVPYKDKIGIKIPPKTSSGQALRLKDLGLPKKGGGYGNLNAKIKIVIPKNISDKQIELYKKIAEL